MLIESKNKCLRTKLDQKKSIFFGFEYWTKLKLIHNIDVMHVEKNVCDNIVGTLLNIEAKEKRHK